MTQNTDANAPEAQIKTIVVDPDDVIEGVRFNGQAPEYKNRRKAVIRLSPPFDSEVVGKIHYSEAGNYYPPDMDPTPVHIRPDRFLDEDMRGTPDRGTVRAEALDELESRGELADMTDDEIEEYRESWVMTANELWESDARQHLVDELSESGVVRGQDEIDVLAGVSVEYETEGSDE